jgi:hypothetical protein
MSRHSHPAPFPRLPAGARTAPDGLLLRPFGLFRDDLDIDFDQRSRPRLLTEVLRCCTIGRDGEAPEEDFFWELPSGKRTECLVAIATLGEPRSLSVRLRCPDEACRQEMEVEISPSELASLQRRGDETGRVVLRVGDEEVQVRLPTGRDQLGWLEAPFDDEGAALKTIVQTLLLSPAREEGTVPDEWVAPIGEALEEIDPLVNFALLVGCPDCGKVSRYEVDLQNVSLGILRRAQQRLLRSVHRLAFHYHWSEGQIFDLPPWRYSHYLALIEEEQ